MLPIPLGQCIFPFLIRGLFGIDADRIDSKLTDEVLFLVDFPRAVGEGRFAVWQWRFDRTPLIGIVVWYGWDFEGPFLGEGIEGLYSGWFLPSLTSGW